jgi:hypothetical protein
MILSGHDSVTASDVTGVDQGLQVAAGAASDSHAASQVVALVMERRWLKFSFNPCRARSVSNSLFVGPKVTCSVIPSFRSFAVKFVISPIPRGSGARNRSLK